MSNEILFLVHMLLVATFVVGALRLGKEALVGVIGLLAVVANLFVIKQISNVGFVWLRVKFNLTSHSVISGNTCAISINKHVIGRLVFDRQAVIAYS